MKKPDAQTALTEYFVAIVGDFYSMELTRLRMRVDPRRYIVGYWNFQEPQGGLGADFSHHLLFPSVLFQDNEHCGRFVRSLLEGW